MGHLARLNILLGYIFGLVRDLIILLGWDGELVGMDLAELGLEIWLTWDGLGRRFGSNGLG